MTYDHFEHCHRFAMWAGARAVQRSFAPSGVLFSAIEATSLPKFLRDSASQNIDSGNFKRRHRGWCNSVIRYLVSQGVEGATFGRAAKLIAVYLKSMVVVGTGSGCSLANVAHPPIDRILLQSLSSSDAICSPHKAGWRSISWTKLGEVEYYELIDELRSVLDASEPFWILEEYWKIDRS